MNKSIITLGHMAIFVFGLFSVTAVSAATYELDDGSGESSLGCSGCDNIWLNAFQAVAGGTQITDLEIAFGSNVNLDPPPDGTPVVAYVWQDPTNDGDPSDAVVVDSVNGTIQSGHTDTFIQFVFPTGATFAEGEWFFVGFQSADFAVARDTDLPNPGQSWIAAWSTGLSDANNLPSADIDFGEAATFGTPGNFLIRANGIASGPPEPIPTLSAWGLGLLAGLLGFAGYRRRVKS